MVPSTSASFASAPRSSCAATACASPAFATSSRRREEQLAETAYQPFIGAEDHPPIEKNASTMAEFKERLEPLYYNPRRYATYLEQLGVDYPQVERPAAAR